MAMSKKERLEWDTLIDKLRVAAAFHRTEPVELDVPVPSVNKIVNGWSFNSYNYDVYKSCSSSIYHGTHNWDMTNTQQPIRQFSTRLRALRALRYAAEEKAAGILAKIDQQIEEELK